MATWSSQSTDLRIAARDAQSLRDRLRNIGEAASGRQLALELLDEGGRAHVRYADMERASSAEAETNFGEEVFDAWADRYRDDNPGADLVTFTDDKGFTYLFDTGRSGDTAARVVGVFGHVADDYGKRDTARMNYQQLKKSSEEQIDRGHMIAHQLGGSDEAHNVVGQVSRINRQGPWRELERNVDEAEAAIAAGDFQRRVDRHMEFHRILARMTGNPIMIVVMDAVLVVLDERGNPQPTASLPSAFRIRRSHNHGLSVMNAQAMLTECPKCGSCYDSTVVRCPNDDEPPAVKLPVELIVDGKYRLERLIGRGGMGIVYRGRDSLMDRPVALKLLPSGAHTGDHPKARRRWLRPGPPTILGPPVESPGGG